MLDGRLFVRTASCWLIAVAGFSSFALAGDWRQFRGNDTSCVADGESVPDRWSADENLAWTADLPGRGLSSPIVIGDRVVVTSATGYRQDRLHVVCFAVDDGKLLWQRQFQATGRTMTFPKIGTATSTPASDGRRICALFSCNDLVCLDLDGNLLWYRGLNYDYPNVSNSLGMASSPVIVGETLIAQVENDSESLAVGIDVNTGLSRWTSPRPKRANWTSPVVLAGANADETVVLLQSSQGIDAIRPESGEVVWTYHDGASTIPSSIAAEGTIYVPSHGITALRIAPGSRNPERLWRVDRLGPGTSSPLVYRNRLYTLNRSNVLLCADLKDGSTLWQLRLEGPFSSTPVAADGHLYFFNEKGLGQVVKVGESQGELASTYDFGEMILCTPAIANHALYVRSDKHLWKIARTAK
jgi:outer membrane protein assembly factor BamB